jgi:hypothetical protein
MIRLSPSAMARIASFAAEGRDGGPQVLLERGIVHRHVDDHISRPSPNLLSEGRGTLKDASLWKMSALPTFTSLIPA